MTRAIAAYAEPGDALLLVSGDRFPLFQFRYDALPKRAQLPDVTTLSVVQVSPQDVERVLAPLAQTHQRVWLAEVEKNLQDADGLLAGWLDKNRHVVWRESYGYNRLSLYGTETEPPMVIRQAGDYPQQAYISALQMQDQAPVLSGVTLMGYDLPVPTVGPGDVAHLVVYLRATQPFTVGMVLLPSTDLKANRREHVLERWTNRIEPEQGITRVRFDIPIFAATPPGEYRFVLVGIVSYPAPRNPVTLDTPLRIIGTRRLETVASVPNCCDWRLGESIRLVGYQSPTQVKPGGALPIKLFWRTTEKLVTRYTVFVHLVGTQHNPKTNGPLWAGHDSEPLDGGYPTPQWFVNTTIADTHVLQLPPETPPGEYEVWAGMYTQPDIQRLSVYNLQGDLVGDHVLLGKVTVVAR
jgi:hypothetical protein